MARPELATIELTNGEWGEVTIVMSFLRWMKSQGLTLPEDGAELDALMTMWVMRNRQATMERLCDEGKLSQSALERYLNQQAKRIDFDKALREIKEKYK